MIAGERSLFTKGKTRERGGGGGIKLKVGQVYIDQRFVDWKPGTYVVVVGAHNTKLFLDSLQDV